MLTLEAAKAYVVAQHARTGEAADVEGCGFIEPDTVRLNVTVTGAHGARSCCQWDVFETSDGRTLHGFYMP